MIEIHRNADLDIALIVVDQSSFERYDLTNAALAFKVWRRRHSREAPILSLSTPAEIEITNAEQGEAVVHIPNTAFSDVDASIYYYEVWLEKDSKKYLISSGDFVVKETAG